MSDSEEQFYSQFGEDQILNKIFKGKQQGLCIEVGGFDGIQLSNSYFFEKLGWDCIVIEPIPELCEAIQKKRTSQILNIAVGSYTGETKFYVTEGVTALSTLEFSRSHLERVKSAGGNIREIHVKIDTLDNLLEAENVKGKEIDFITIDVEGHELDVLQGFSIQKYEPRIILIEDNLGVSDRRIDQLMSQAGYVRFKRTGCNDWYAKRTNYEIVNRSAVWKLKLRKIELRLKHTLKQIYTPK